MCWRDWQVKGGCVLLCHIKAATGRMQRSFGFSVICGLRLVCSANSGQVSSAGGQFWVEKPDNQLKSSPGATRGGLAPPPCSTLHVGALWSVASFLCTGGLLNTLRCCTTPCLILYSGAVIVLRLHVQFIGAIQTETSRQRSAVYACSV